MSIELNLRFPDEEHVIVSFDGEDSGALPFSNPLTVKDGEELRWYLESYGAHSLGDPDDSEAKRVVEQLPVWGQALFDAVFGERAAQRLFNGFQDTEDDVRLLTISAEQPAILALPWELLHDSGQGGVFLFIETPRISIRRRVAGATGGRRAFKVESRERLHLLFVISRPEGCGFIDPRADASAVFDAVEANAPGRFTWEVLRPPTLDVLVERLEDDARVRVDILHFDGHGVFDRHGGLPEAVADRKIILEQILSGQVLKGDAEGTPAESPPHTGYLLFEDGEGEASFVSAGQLGQNLHRHNIPLIVLSACQSATLGESDEPLGCVAARLTAGGSPAVLAMTHSVLVPTTRALFGEFYKHIAKGHGIGESLDNARRYLVNHPEKYEVQRGPERAMLRLHDWFVPALYQADEDMPLVEESGGVPADEKIAAVHTNIPEAPEAGFFGRKRELWEIERWFADRARRITITGFGGQGKTALAQEAARWLTRTGLFEAAVFVDYSSIQALDAVAVAVTNIGSVLGESLIDADAAAEALGRTATLLVLDNLEAVAEEPLRELLDAARVWSEAGSSRVLITTRTPDFGHAHYCVEGTHIHRRIVLDGLGRSEAPDDALEWFAELFKLPPAPTVQEAPTREALVDLFDKVRFHPLSIHVLAHQLKTRIPAELGERLEQLLGERVAAPGGEPSPQAIIPELVASVNLSLDRLDDAAREVLPRLGVFQGGAFADDLPVITGLGGAHERKRLEALLVLFESGKAPPDPGREMTSDELQEQAVRLREILARMPAAGIDVWPDLRRQLEGAALIQAETVPGVKPPFLRFHPTLAPMLWERLGPEERAELTIFHRQRYFLAARFLYFQDRQHPHQTRAVALRELPNLLHAVRGSLAAQDAEAAEFATCVTHWLTIFGLKREAEDLTALASAAAVEGSEAWRLAQSDLGSQLLTGGQVAQATEVFESILAKLAKAPSYEWAVTLALLARCHKLGGRPDLAAKEQSEGIAVLEKLEQTGDVKALTGLLHTGLGDALMESGQYSEARKEYEAGLAIDEGLGDLRGQGVDQGQLGSLAAREGNLQEALTRHQAALALFRRLREPDMEAVAWHQLGLVYHELEEWDEAERHYRESARIKEEHGNLGSAARSWNQLALLCEDRGRLTVAEQWHRKAIDVQRASGNTPSLSSSLSNLASLLRTQPGRLSEAQQLAKEGLDIKKTLDSAAAQIWKTYGILADIADDEAAATSDAHLQAEFLADARDYRRLARDAKRGFAGTRDELRKHGLLITLTVTASQQPEHREELEALLLSLEGSGWSDLTAGIRRVLAGERTPETACEGLDLEDAMIIEAILAALNDPSKLEDLLRESGPE